jgi:hypothetical protein
MRKKNYKGRCEKRSLSKCKEVCRSYSDIQSRYADKLQSDPEIESFECNVRLDDTDYTSDFVIQLSSGDIRVRECVQRSHLIKPMTAKLLDLSRDYWLHRGVADWGIVIEKEGSGDEEK